MNAANFEKVHWRGHPVLAMSGAIERGDARALLDALRGSETLPHGNPVLLLNSGGGLVDEAILMAEIVAGRNVHTVIPAGARCSSACASILFLGGVLRTVEEGGLLGQHSCAVGGVASQACNDQIASFAIDRGVSHGSVAAFVTYVAPDDILFFNREEADGWGLTRYPGETEAGFQKSEPLAIASLTGELPAAQALWRLDFNGDGYRAFLRPFADHSSELELNIFCYEEQRGHLFLEMQTLGAAADVSAAIDRVRVSTDRFSFEDPAPAVVPHGAFTGIRTEFPSARILPLLEDARVLEVEVMLHEPYQPLWASSRLAGSRKNLIFAANTCATSRAEEALMGR